MPRIATLTLNPAIDASGETEAVIHTAKLRTTSLRHAPGGGGLNVAQVLTRLGAGCEALYLAGGITGPVLQGLLDRAGHQHRALDIAGDTRISLNITEHSTGHEYRFVPEGPLVSAAEAEDVLAEVAALEADWLVLSGSLPRGLPDDFYAAIIKAARARQIAVVLDTSGPPLMAALAAGGIRLVKPNLAELAQVAGHPLETDADILAAARAIVDKGCAQSVAVSMGDAGALLVEAGHSLRLPAIPVSPKSAVGAGDSFVAAMTLGLAHGWPSDQALRLGLAAGTAAILTPGTDLCHRADVARLAATLGLSALP